jgi:hypothetical protein
VSCAGFGGGGSGFISGFFTSNENGDQLRGTFSGFAGQRVGLQPCFIDPRVLWEGTVGADVSQRNTEGVIIGISNLAVTLAIDFSVSQSQCKDVEIDDPGPIEGGNFGFSVLFLDLPTLCRQVVPVNITYTSVNLTESRGQ